MAKSEMWAIVRRRVTRSVSALLAACLLLAGCGGDDSANPIVDEEEAEISSRCEAVGPFILRGIEEGLTVTGGGSLRAGQAVRSGDFERAYFVAADIEGAGMEGPDQVGVWVTNRLNEARGAFSVNDLALEFSDWGDGGKTDAEFTMFDDGASEAEGCARAAAR